jgi:hypothetical protein
MQPPTSNFSEEPRDTCAERHENVLIARSCVTEQWKFYSGINQDKRFYRRKSETRNLGTFQNKKQLRQRLLIKKKDTLKLAPWYSTHMTSESVTWSPFQ